LLFPPNKDYRTLLKGERGEGKGLGNGMWRYNFCLYLQPLREETMEKYDARMLPTGSTQKIVSYHVSPLRPPNGQ